MTAKEILSPQVVAQAVCSTLRWLADTIERASSEGDKSRAQDEALRSLSVVLLGDEARALVESITTERIRCAWCFRVVPGSLAKDHLCRACADTNTITLARLVDSTTAAKTN